MFSALLVSFVILLPAVYHDAPCPKLRADDDEKGGAVMNQKMRKAMGWFLSLCVMGVWATPISRQIYSLPDVLYLTEGEARSLTLGFPFEVKVLDEQVVDAEQSQSVTTGERFFSSGEVVLTSNEEGRTQLELSLFGIIPLRRVGVTVQKDRMLIPGGQSIGVAMHTRGTLVVGRSEIVDEQGKAHNPAEEAGLKPGEVITEVNGQAVENSKHLSELVNSSQDSRIKLTVENAGKARTITIEAVKDRQDGLYRLGIWVRDSTAGVGTLSYIDPANMAFGALGHAITDLDTGKILEVGDGEIFESQILSIQQGASGNPGELKGAFDGSAAPLGRIDSNQQYGIYGFMDELPENSWEAVPIASHDQVHLGAATILSTVDDGGIKAYDVEITRLYPQSSAAAKGIVLKVVDPELLDKTGGIVQGMSGSPILQDGRLVGAVTHVFINDPVIGHGIYIDWMLEQSDAMESRN